MTSDSFLQMGVCERPNPSYNEEIQLSDYGMMMWGNVRYDYAQAVKGYSSNLNNAMYTERGWNDPHLVTYIESHDEERIMYVIQQNGFASGDYNIKNQQTALDRAVGVFGGG